MRIARPTKLRAVWPGRLPRRSLGGVAVFAILMVRLGPGSITGPAHAAAPSPRDQAEAAVREIITRDLSTSVKVEDKKNDDRRFMAPDLYRLYTAKGKDFDADPYTGTQDGSDYSIAKLRSDVKSNGAIDVTVEFAVASLPNSHPREVYKMVLLRDRWLVQDIVYVGDVKSLRDILKGMH